MNNEEKILSILETMNGRMDTMNGRMDTISDRVETISDRMDTMNDRVDAIASDVSTLKAGQAKLEAGQEKLEAGQAKLEKDLESVRNSVTRIELDHGKKLDALFEGNKQLNEKVDRIEAHVSAQDEVILKRVFPLALESK